ncbi:MAG: hypothetical protein SNJ68_01725 [Cyanobacteriota bacterium]
MVCHGVKGSRPDFILKNDPQDLAYDFKGCRRGLWLKVLRTANPKVP